MKSLFNILTIISLFFLLGTTGAADRGLISIATWAIRMAITFGCFGLFCKLADMCGDNRDDE